MWPAGLRTPARASLVPARPPQLEIHDAPEHGDGPGTEVAPRMDRRRGGRSGTSLARRIGSPGDDALFLRARAPVAKGVGWDRKDPCDAVTPDERVTQQLPDFA